MLYALIGEDRSGSLSARQAVRTEHLARIKQLDMEGRLLLAGPFPAIDALDPGEAGFSGSLIVAEFDSLEVAQKWFEADPYVGTGVFTHTEVKPFKKVLP